MSLEDMLAATLETVGDLVSGKRTLKGLFQEGLGEESDDDKTAPGEVVGPQSAEAPEAAQQLPSPSNVVTLRPRDGGAGCT
jgi:hypothetical protein